MVVSKSPGRLPASNLIPAWSRRFPPGAVSLSLLFICCLLLASCAATDPGGVRSLTDSSDEAGPDDLAMSIWVYTARCNKFHEDNGVWGWESGLVSTRDQAQAIARDHNDTHGHDARVRRQKK